MSSKDHLSPVAAQGCLRFRLQQSVESSPELCDFLLLCQLQMLMYQCRDCLALKLDIIDEYITKRSI